MTPAAHKQSRFLAYGEGGDGGGGSPRVRDAFWRKPLLAPHLFPDQLPFYNFLASRVYGKTPSPGILVGNIHRQFGKSFILCLLVTEFALRTPGRLVRLVAPTQRDLRKIIQPNMRVLLQDCPEDCRPQWRGFDGLYLFPNGSEIHIAGANGDRADDSRGQCSHLNVIDEAGFIDELDYLLKSVLLPQTLTTGGKTVLISTPPPSPAHELIPILRDAEAGKAYFVHSLDQTTHLSHTAKRSLVRDMGGIDSTQAQRELFCQIVVDETRAVCPEFTGKYAEQAIVPVEPPTYETPLVAMDVGFEDYSHVLYGYYHWKTARLHIQAETRLRRMRTDQLAEAIKQVESRLWPNPKRSPARVSDVDLILLHDLTTIHNLNFQPTAKDEKEAMVNELRLWVQRGRLIIDPSCTHLIRQLKTAVWNKRRTSFERTASDGHFDGVDALIYMIRNAPICENPYPALPETVQAWSHQIKRGAKDDTDMKALKELFGIGRKR